jgi:Spy/CpxP family protein refolding chaperone
LGRAFDPEDPVRAILERNMDMRYRILVAGLVAVGCLATTAIAQEHVEKRVTEQNRAREGRRGAESDQHAFIQRLLQGLQLNQDQRSQVREILETQRQALENWRKENTPTLHDLRGKLKNLRGSGDREKAQGLREELQKLMESRKALHDSLMQRLSGVLNAEQMSRVKAAVAQRVRQAWDRALANLRRLELTDAQKQKISQIVEEAKAKADQTEDPRERGQILRDTIEKIRSEVLTDAQRSRLAEAAPARPGGREAEMLRGLDLTEEQIAQLRSTGEEFRSKLREADSPEARRELMRQRREQISQVLTEGQREQLRNRMRERGGSRARRPERAGRNQTD